MEVLRIRSYEAVLFLFAQLAWRRQRDIYAHPLMLQAALAIVLEDLRSDQSMRLQELFEVATLAMDVVRRDHEPCYVYQLRRAKDDCQSLENTLSPLVREVLLSRLDYFGHVLSPLPALAAAK